MTSEDDVSAHNGSDKDDTNGGTAVVTGFMAMYSGFWWSTY